MYSIQPVQDHAVFFDMLKHGGKVGKAKAKAKAKAKQKQKQTQKVIINIGSKQIMRKTQQQAKQTQAKQTQPLRPIIIDRPMYIQGQQGEAGRQGRQGEIIIPVSTKIDKTIVGELKEALIDNKIDTKEFDKFDKLIKEQNETQQSLKKSILEEAVRKRKEEALSTTEALSREEAEPPSFEEVFGEQKLDKETTKIRDDYATGLTLKNQKRREASARKRIAEVDSLRGMMAEELREKIEDVEEIQKKLLSQSDKILERMKMQEPDAQEKFNEMMKKNMMKKDK